MKKAVLFIFVGILVCFFSACKERTEENEFPDVTSEANSINLSISKITGMKYVNIFRQEENVDEFYNIGQIVPARNSPILSFTYTDSYVKTGIKYKYALRYMLADGYRTTGWTEFVSTTTAFSDYPQVNVSAAANMVYNKTDRTLSIGSGTYTNPAVFSTPASEFYLSLAISNGTSSTVIPCVSPAGSSFPLLNGIDLRSILTSSYFDVPITIKGLLFQKKFIKKDSDGKELYTIYYLTVPKEIKILDTNNEDTEGKITVDFISQKDEGLDYSNVSVGVKSLNARMLLDY